MSTSSKVSAEETDLQVTYVEDYHTEVEWKIKNFYDLPEREAYCVDSPPFWLSGEEYRIRITPRFKGYVCLCFVRKPSQSRTEMDLIAALKKVDGSVHGVGTADFNFQENVALKGCQLLPRSEVETAKFRDDFAPEGTWTLVCRVHAEEEDEGGVADISDEEMETEPECFTYLSTDFCTLRMLDAWDGDCEEKEQLKENQSAGKESLERSDNINQERKRTIKGNRPRRKKKRMRL